MSDRVHPLPPHAPPGALSRAPPRAWSPPPLIVATAVLHVAAFLWLLIAPQDWRLLLATVVANHLLLCAAVLWPRGSLLGANLTRLPPAAIARREIVLSFDDGPDPEVTPQVLELLDRHRVKASFFCIAARARAHPQLLREIVARGHSVENHSARHAHTFSFLGWRGTLREIAAAQDALANLAGSPPRFFRAPAGFRGPFVDAVLARLGLRYASWTRRGYDSLRGDADGVLRRLTRGLAAGDILLLHDGRPARTAGGVPVVLEVLPRLLRAISERQLRAVSLPAAMTAEAERGSAGP